MRKTALKYKIIRIRAKLSYAAFQQRVTVQELVLKAIIESYKDLVKQKFIIPDENYEESEQQVNILMTSNVGQCLRKII